MNDIKRSNRYSLERPIETYTDEELKQLYIHLGARVHLHGRAGHEAAMGSCFDLMRDIRTEQRERWRIATKQEAIG